MAGWKMMVGIGLKLLEWESDQSIWVFSVIKELRTYWQ